MNLKNNCPVRERTGDDKSVGRCWRWMEDGKTCPVHGNVYDAVQKYISTGKLTDEKELAKGDK